MEKEKEKVITFKMVKIKFCTCFTVFQRDN